MRSPSSALEPPAQQGLLGQPLTGGVARVGPGGPLPLDAENVELRGEAAAVRGRRPQAATPVQKGQRQPGAVGGEFVLAQGGEGLDQVERGRRVPRVGLQGPPEATGGLSPVGGGPRPAKAGEQAQGVVRPAAPAGAAATASRSADRVGSGGPWQLRRLPRPDRQAVVGPQQRPPPDRLPNRRPFRLQAPQSLAQQRIEAQALHAGVGGGGDRTALVLVGQVRSSSASRSSAP